LLLSIFLAFGWLLFAFSRTFLASTRGNWLEIGKSQIVRVPRQRLPRVLTSFLLISLAAAAIAQSNAIILIRPEAVGRVIRPEEYDHGLWIQWPLASTDIGSNRLLSTITGLNWRLSNDPFTQPSTLRTHNNLVADPSLEWIGVYQARLNWLGAMETVVLQNGLTPVDPNAEILGVDSHGNAVIHQVGERLQGTPLLIYSAQSWDDAARVEKLAAGNSIIIVYPPPLGSTVSAAWMKDRTDVPVLEPTRVPGLVPAREVVGLLQHPATYTWRDSAGITAQQWMETINASRGIQLISFFCFALLISMWAIRSVAVEAGGRLARFGIAMIPIAFVSLLLAGNIAKLTGLLPWNSLPFFAYFGLLLGLVPVYLGMRALWPKAHLLFPIAFFSAIFFLWADPLYSVFSHVFTPVPLPVSPLALGGLAASLTATCVFALSGGLWPRILAATLLCSAMLMGVLGHAWWTSEMFLLVVPLLALIAGAGQMRLYLLPVFVIWPFLYGRWNGHFAWDVNWLLNNYSDRYAINAAAQMQFLVSPAWLATLATFVVTALVGGDFLKHQLRRVFSENNNSRALFWAALAMACLGLREPYLLESALVVLISGFLVLLFDAAGSL
jgi:hypothetical protein